jgi:Arc/MetJ-type ribon-helix-helix transcriptional regulator
MSKSMTLNVRVNGPLGEFVAANVGDDGTYENVSEYVRDLIRKDKERAERAVFDRLKAELGAAFAAPDDSYGALTAHELIARNQARQSV